jgi:DnaJ-class molecular chaperone
MRRLLTAGAALALLLPATAQARTPNLYAMLDLETSDVDESILRRSFRHKALEVHPDKQQKKKKKKKQQNATDALQDPVVGDEVTFELVNEAYELLKGRERAPDTVVRVGIPMRNILGPNKYASARVQRVAKTTCRACQGRGSPLGTPKARRCQGCHGSGRGTVRFGCQGSQPCIQFSGACGICGGAGWIGNRCMVCGGSGTTSETRYYTAQYPVGSEDGHSLRVVGEGDVPNGETRPGDLVLEMQTTPHQLYERIDGRPLDVRTRLESGADRLRKGFTMTVERLGGKDMGYVTVTVPADPTIGPGDRKTVRVTGFTEAGGCLDIVIDVKEQVWVF